MSIPVGHIIKMDVTETASYSETELLAAIKSGNSYAFNELYRIHHASIYRNLRRLLRDDDVAMEITQDTFLKIWEKRIQLDPDKSLRAYLCRISRNMMIDFYRKAKRNKEMIDNLQIFTTEFSDQHVDTTLYTPEEELLMTAIEMLPPQRKKIFMLCKLESKTYEQVSTLLGISSSTISDHIVKATKAIRNRLVDPAKLVLIMFVPCWVQSIHDLLRKIV